MKYMTKILPLVLLCTAAVDVALAQQADRLRSQLLEGTGTTMQPSQSIEQLPLDAPLAPTEYRVGGGDRFTIQLGTMPPVNLTLSVGIDGTLLIPSIGEIAVGSLSLAEAIERIKMFVAERNRMAAISISLAAARQVRIRVSGSAAIEGTLEAVASDRVSSIVADPRAVRSSEPVVTMDTKRRTALVSIARRSLLLHRADGTSHRVDLERFEATGASEWNPHVSEGDEIVVNLADETVPSVAIGGAVWRGGSYEYVSGDRIGDLIRFARGLRPEAVSDSAVLSRAGTADRIVNVSGVDTAITVEAGDRLRIPGRRPSGKADIVVVMGEVSTPGMYPIVAGTTRLSSVIGMAGGLRESAMVHGATLHRSEVALVRHNQEQLLSLRGNTVIEDISYVRQEEELRLLGERVQADLVEALKDPGGPRDPILQSGDKVFVPRRIGSVYVFGQVVSPGHLAYVPGTSFDGYIKASGGFTDRAKSGDGVVIKYASRQWLDPSETVVEEGDAIWVPKKVEQSFATELSAYSQIVGIAGSIATIILVIVQLGK